MSRFSLVLIVCMAAATLASCRKEAQPNASSQVELWKQKYESLTGTVEEQYGKIEGLKEENDNLSRRVASLDGELERCKEQVATPAEAERLKQELLQQERLAEELREKVKELGADHAASDLAGKVEALQEQLRALRDRGCRIAEGLERAGGGAFRAGDYQVALPILMAAVELGADNLEIPFQIAYCLGQAGDLKGAESQYAAVIEKANEDVPGDAELLKKAYVNRGAALARLKKPQEALDHYQKAIELGERYAPVYFNLGLLCQGQLNDAKSAIEAFRRHIMLGGSRAAAARNAIRALQSTAELESDDQEPE